MPTHVTKFERLHDRALLARYPPTHEFRACPTHKDFVGFWYSTSTPSSSPDREDDPQVRTPTILLSFDSLYQEITIP